MIHFLKNLGYKDPTAYKVCIKSNHITLVEDENCPDCGTSRSTCTDYFVLGLQLEHYFLNESVILDHLEHWASKEEWIGEAQIKYKEIRYGKRFKELSYVWDVNSETVLPICCPNCDSITSVREMAAFVPPGSTLQDKVKLYMSCKDCLFDFVHILKTMKGCPLNQAFIFHEDGFNAFERKSRGMSAIHVSSGCISKEKDHRGNI